MNKKAIIFIVALFLSFTIQAQEQWASSIIKYSSQAGYKAYGAKQVLGKPNALQAIKNPVAWSPQGANTGLEYIVVGFQMPTKVQQIAVWENFNPGAIYQIYLIEPNGKEHKVYEQGKPEEVMEGARMFRHSMKLTSYNVSSLKLVLNTAEVFGLNQIDAIGISPSKEPMRPTINNPKDKTFVGKPENLGYEVNSKSPDLLPLISIDGQTLYFARKNHPENIGPQMRDDIYVAHKNSKSLWTPGRNIGPPLNNEYNNFVCAVNPDGTEVLISGTYDQGEGLYRTSLSNGTWSKPQKINIDGYSNKSPFVCYHVSPDMKFLVIAMEDHATYGDMDIYVSFKKPDGSYTKPKNLGPTINTAAKEPSVFLSADGKTIYFSSEGHPGYGAYDMYMSRRLDNSWGKWSEPINLGDQINSDDWDLYYTVPADGMYAYYSSANNSYGESDLYRIKLPKDVRPEPVAILKPNFVNINTKTPVAKLEKKNNTIVLNDDSKVSLYEEVKGFYPVNETEDLSAELEEEDNYTEIADIEKVADPMDSKMEDLLARLQELKNEEAKTESELKKVSAEPEASVKSSQSTASIKPYNAQYSSDLDDKLAALRSNMDKIESGEKPEEINLNEQTKNYKVKPGMKNYEKANAKNDELSAQQKAQLDQYDSKNDALQDYKSANANNNVAPREVTKKSYNVRTVSPDDYLAEHQTYKDQLKELAEQKAKAAYGTQPLTKYSLAKTSIDKDMNDALVASSMKSELADLKEKQKQPTAYNPEVDAYRKKLDELKAKQKSALAAPKTGTRITSKPADDLKTTASNENPKVVDEEVLAYQEKLAALKDKMSSLPSSEGLNKNEENTVASAKVEETKEPITASASPTTTNKKVPGKVNQPDAKINKKRGKKVEQAPEVVAINIPDQPKVEPKKEAESINPSEEAQLLAKKEAIYNDIKDKEVEKGALDENLDDLKKDTEAARKEKAAALEEMENAEQARKALEAEKAKLEADKLAMEQQKQELQDIIAQLQKEKDQFLADQAKIESDRKKLEGLRLQQHKQVKKLEGEIRALEQQKGKAQEEVSIAKATASNKPKTTTVVDKEIFLMPVEEGVTVEIRNVFFNANSAYVKPASYKELDKVVAFLEVNSGIEIEIGGHTNGLCQSEYCNKLSEKRAISVREYIVSKGLPAYRIKYKGYGKSVPIADNKSSEGRKKNQRVELKILKIN